MHICTVYRHTISCVYDGFFRNACFRTCSLFGTFPWDPPLLFQQSWLMIVPHPMEIMLKKTSYMQETWYYIPGNWNPNDRCFDRKRPCFERLTFKNRGHWGSRYIYIYTYYMPFLRIRLFCRLKNPMLVDISMEVVHSLSAFRTLRWTLDVRRPRDVDYFLSETLERLKWLRGRIRFWNTLFSTKVSNIQVI